jgi:ABC-2 type transport system permease protein
MIWTVAKKELRGYFNSAIAVIFLTAFLAIAFYTFFWREKFFARGVADLRPLFEWMPRLLIILVSALAMRLWADERRAGTLEVLLTLPVPRWKLVLGKFAAGLLLIALALALTLGLPITISQMGHLDWGPVIGGYLAALLLSAAYLAIGMCVSAATDNQIVAFVGTAFLCGIAYAIGDAGAVGQFLGTGVRFESVARGVLDLRDLAYYGGIVATGIALNVLLLQRLTWGHGARTRPRRIGAVLAVVLVAANAIALDAWLAPVHRARIDLTQDGTYSLSNATRKVLGGLDEHVLIRGYFSEQMHPLLAPLVPQIRDLLEEYRIAGGGKVRVEFVDPTDDDAAKREAKERFGVEAQPLRFANANEQSVINAYFAIAIEYGDQHAVLNIDDLINIRSVDAGQLEITPKNLEYQLTKTIRKTAAEFASIDALFASTSGKIQLTAYLTPSALPDNWKDAPAKLDAVVKALVAQSNGKLEYKVVQPSPDGDEARALMAKYGVRPYVDLLGGQPYYFALILQIGDRAVRVVPPDTLGEEQLKASITEGLRRAAPGFTKVVGVWTPPPGAPEPMPEGMPQRPAPPPQSFRALETALAGDYEILDVPLTEPVPTQVQTLVLAGPASLTAAQLEHLDQYVMRGGALVVLDGQRRLAPADGLAVERVTTGLEPLFAAWGIHVGDQLVMDRQSESFPVPTGEREVHQLPYPFFVKLDGDELDRDSPITSGLSGAVMHWTVAVGADGKVGDDEHHVDTLLRSSPAAWLTASNNVEPDLAQYPQTGFAEGSGSAGAQSLAVAISGGFASGTPAPKDEKAQLLAHSPPDTRIVVFGSSAFVSDDIVQLSQQLQSELAMSNIELVHDAVDWSLGDTDLLVVRGHNAQAHALTVAADARGTWRIVNVLLAALGLCGVVLVAWLRRRSVEAVL